MDNSGLLTNVTPCNEMLTYDALSFRTLSGYCAKLTLDKKSTLVTLLADLLGDFTQILKNWAHLFSRGFSNLPLNKNYFGTKTTLAPTLTLTLNN